MGFHGYPSRESSNGVKKPGRAALALSASVKTQCSSHSSVFQGSLHLANVVPFVKRLPSSFWLGMLAKGNTL